MVNFMLMSSVFFYQNKFPTKYSKNFIVFRSKFLLLLTKLIIQNKNYKFSFFTGELLKPGPLNFKINSELILKVYK